MNEMITPIFIEYEMFRHGFSVQFLAENLGVTKRAVDHWIKGSRRPNLRDSERLLNVFGYKVDVTRIERDGNDSFSMDDFMRLRAETSNKHPNIDETWNTDGMWNAGPADTRDSNGVIWTFTDEQIKRLGAVTNVNGVASVLGCSVQYARRLCENGTLEAVKMGSNWRVKTSSLLEFAGLR